MNKIENKFLLAGDKFMPQMHLRSLELIVIKKVIKLLVILTVKKLLEHFKMVNCKKVKKSLELKK